MNEELGKLIYEVVVESRNALKQIEGVKKELQQLREEMGQAKKGTDDLSAGVKNAGDKQLTFGKLVSKNSYALRQLARVTTILGGVIVGIFAKGTREMMRYQLQLADVSTMVLKTGAALESQMDVYDKHIRRLSVTYNQSTTVLTKGLYDILSATFEGAGAMNILEHASISAVAGLTEVQVAADALTTILNSYSLSAEHAGDVSDWLWAIVRRGKVTYDQLAGSIGKVSAIASVAGMNMDELGAMIMTATRAGVRHEVVTTSINSVLMSFMKATERSKQRALEFGISLDSTTLSTEGLIGVLEKLTTATDGHAKATAGDIAKIFENRRALRVIMPLVQNFAGFQEDLMYQTRRSGYALTAYNKIANTAEFELQKLGKQFTMFRMELGEYLIPVITSLIQSLSSMLNWFRDLSPTVQKLLVILGLTTGAVLLLTGALSYMIPVLAAIKGLSMALWGKLAIIGAVIGAIGLISTSLVVGKKATDDYKASIDESTKSLHEAEKAMQEYSESAKYIRDLKEEYEGYEKMLAKSEKGKFQHKYATASLTRVTREMVKAVDDASIAEKALNGELTINKERLKEVTEETKARTLALVDNRIENAKFQQEILSMQVKNMSSLDELQKKAKESMKSLQDARESFRLAASNLDLDADSEMIRDGLTGTEEAYERFYENVQKLQREKGGDVFTLAQIANLRNWGELIRATTGDTTAYNDATRERMNAEEGLAAIDEEISKLEKQRADLVSGLADKQAEALGVIRKNVDAYRDLKQVTLAMDAAYLGNTETLHDLSATLADAEEKVIAYYAAMEQGVDTGLNIDELEKDVERASKALFDFKVDYTTTYKEALTQTIDDQVKFGGMRLDIAIEQLEAKVAALKASNEISLSEERVFYEKIAEYRRQNFEEQTRIFNEVNESIKGDYTNFVADILDFNKDLGDSFKDLGDNIWNSFRNAFAKSLVEKAGFDKIFEGNIADLGNLVGGLGKSVEAVFSNVFGTLGLTKGATEAAVAEGVVSSSMTAAQAYSMGIQGPALQSGMFTTSMTAAQAHSLGIQGPALESGMFTAPAVAPTAASAGLGANISAAISAVLPPVLIGALAAHGIIQGAEDLKKAFEGNMDSLEDLDYALTGVGKMVQPVAALLDSLAGDSTAGFIATKALAWSGVGTMIFPGVGTALGGIAGAVYGLAESMGIIKHGPSWEEEFSEMVNDFHEGNMRQDELFTQTFLRETNYLHDYWGKQSVDMEASWGERMAEYLKYEKTGLFTDEQLDELKAAMRLGTTEEELAEQKRQTAEGALEDIWTDKFWKEFKDDLHLWQNELEGVGEAWESATDAYVNQGLDFWDSFMAELDELPGLTEDVRERVERIGSEAFKAWDEEGWNAAFELEGWRAHLEEMGALLASNEIYGQDLDRLFKDLDLVMQKFFDPEWDLDLEKTLENMGLTGPLWTNFIEDMKELQEAGVTEFEHFSDDMKDKIREGFEAPDQFLNFEDFDPDEARKMGKLYREEVKRGAGEEPVDIPFIQTGLDEILESIEGIPTELRIAIKYTEENEPPSGGVPSAQSGGFTGTREGLWYLHPNEYILPADKVQSLISGLLSGGANFAQNLPSSMRGIDIKSPAFNRAEAPAGSGGITIAPVVNVSSGVINDALYWQNVAREKIIPAVDQELRRYGKRLGG